MKERQMQAGSRCKGEVEGCQTHNKSSVVVGGGRNSKRRLLCMEQSQRQQFWLREHKSVRTKLPNCTGAHGRGRICNPEVISTCLRFLSCRVPIGVPCRMSTVVKLSQTGRCGKPRGRSEWSVKDTPGIGACLLEEWALNELRSRDWFGVRALHSLSSTNV